MYGEDVLNATVDECKAMCVEKTTTCLSFDYIRREKKRLFAKGTARDSSPLFFDLPNYDHYEKTNDCDDYVYLPEVPHGKIVICHDCYNNRYLDGMGRDGYTLHV